MTLETLKEETEEVNSVLAQTENVQQKTPPQKRWRRRRNWRTSRFPERERSERSYGLVEKMFWYYNLIKKEVETVHAERGYYQSQSGGGNGSSNRAFVSDPTFQRAIKQIEEVKSIIINADKIDEEVVRYPERWLKVVEQTLAYYDGQDIGEVLRRRFIKNEPMPTTCIDMENVSKDRYYRLRDAGLIYARECAIQLGVIKVFHDAEEEVEN